MLLSFANNRLISFQDYRALCQLVFKIDSLLEKIDLLEWEEKLIANQKSLKVCTHNDNNGGIFIDF